MKRGSQSSTSTSPRSRGSIWRRGPWSRTRCGKLPDISQYGLIQCDEAGRVTAFKEKVPRDDTGRNTVNFALYVMSHDVVGHIPGRRDLQARVRPVPALA